MPRLSHIAAISAALICAVGAVACGSGKGDAPERTNTPAGSVTAAGRVTPSGGSPAVRTPDPERTAAPGATSSAATTPSGAVASGATRASGPVATAPAASVATAPPPPPPPVGRTFTLSEAQSLAQSAVVGAGDLPAGWTTMNDTTSDNAAAAASDPRAGASFERCGRLTGRLLTLQPPADQLVARYLGGESVSFFTNITVYATAAGAADCAAEAAVRFSEPGELARQFAAIFVNVPAVVVTPVPYPPIADGSFAATLKGRINAAGTEVDLTILIVAFRKGNVTAVVGSAAAGAPSTAELSPLVDRVVQRIAAAQ